MNREEEIVAQSYLDEIYDHWGPRLELVGKATIAMTGSDHGYTQWTVGPVEFAADDINAGSEGVTDGQIGVVVIDEADDRWVQVVAIGQGRVTTLQPIIINPSDPRAPSGADFAPGEGTPGALKVMPRKLRSDYNSGEEANAG